MLDRQAIPKAILQRETEEDIEFDEALGSLLAFSLITALLGGASFELHRLVQLSTKKWLELQGTLHR
jgi:hypothetical protein